MYNTHIILLLMKGFKHMASDIQVTDRLQALYTMVATLLWLLHVQHVTNASKSVVVSIIIYITSLQPKTN
jgi:hypothetical protein